MTDGLVMAFSAACWSGLTNTVDRAFPLLPILLSTMWLSHSGLLTQNKGSEF